MYSSKMIFSYAAGLYAIFPRGLENREVGEGSIVVENDYIIYFRPETPEEIKQRVIKDYAEYHAKSKELGWY